jgi:hypothetical protein
MRFLVAANKLLMHASNIPKSKRVVEFSMLYTTHAKEDSNDFDAQKINKITHSFTLHYKELLSCCGWIVTGKYMHGNNSY